MKRIILEMGMGNDLYGEDYTKAACRAVEDAIRHSSLILFRSLGFDHADMQVKVTIGVQRPDCVDTSTVAQKLPRETTPDRTENTAVQTHPASSPPNPQEAEVRRHFNTKRPPLYRLCNPCA